MASSTAFKRTRLSFDTLEDRLVPVRFQFDYSLDTNGFFNTQAKKDLLQQAGEYWTARLADSLGAITAPTNGSWTASFTHPGTGASTSRQDLTVPADTILVFAGGRDLSGSTLGFGGSGGMRYSTSGSGNLPGMLERGQSGSLADPPTEVAPWGGHITFDTVGTQWHFGASQSGLDSGESDFLSVAVHELGHVLGINNGALFQRWIVNGKFTGPKARALYGSDVPAGGAHFAEGVTYKNQEVAMDPTIDSGTRKLPTDLDFAALDDIGWAIGTLDDTMSTALQWDGLGGIISRTSISHGKDVDMYRVTLARGMPLGVRATNLSNLDLYLKVFHADGTLYKSNDDGGPGTDPELDFIAPYSGDFYIAVSTYDNRNYDPNRANSGPGGPTGSYEFGLSVDIDPSDAGDRIASALNTGLSGTSGSYAVEASLVLGDDDIDMYRFTASAGTTLTAVTSKPAGRGHAADTFLRLFNAAGKQLLARDGGGTGLYARLQFTFTNAGTYYLGVSDTSNRTYDPNGGGISSSSDGADYRLEISLGSSTGGGDALMGSSFPHLIARTASGQWWVGENRGSIVGVKRFGAWNEAAGWKFATVGDFSGDGNADVLGRTARGRWILLENTGDRFQNRSFGSWNEALGWRDVRVGDFSGDGLLDVVARNVNGTWFLGLNNGAAFDFQPYGQWDKNAGWRDVRVGDFDGDGNTDVIGRTAAGNWGLLRNTGTGFENRFFGSWDKNAGWRDVQVADFDGDGLIDIIGRTNAGNWGLLHNTGTGFENQFYGSWNKNAGWRDVRVGDFDGDNRPDVIGRTAAGNWIVGVNNGTRFENRSYGRWSGNWANVMVGNFSGSGRDDLVGRIGGNWYLATNTGSALVTTLFSRWNPNVSWRGGMSGAFYNGGGSDNGLHEQPVIFASDPLQRTNPSRQSSPPFAREVRHSWALAPESIAISDLGTTISRRRASLI